MLMNLPISSIVEALEDSIVIDIQHDKYREILKNMMILKCIIFCTWKTLDFYKKMIQHHSVLNDAKERYEKFKMEYGHILSRLSQYHIASYLGISPTHLSRN